MVNIKKLRNIDRRPIGIFDSGIGGLTVLKEIESILPFENIVYFGDTARVPYGNKSKTTILNFSQKNVNFLLKKNVKMIVIACNTSSALALNQLRKYTKTPIIEVITPGVVRSLSITSNNKIGIIATQTTINSRAYETIIGKIAPNVKTYSKSCPLFVPLVEEGIFHGRIIKEAIKLYLAGLKTEKIDTLILGCTHYPLIKKEISIFLKNVQIVDSGKEVAHSVKKELEKGKLLNSFLNKNKTIFYVSDDPNKFVKSAEFFLDRKITALRAKNY